MVCPLKVHGQLEKSCKQATRYAVQGARSMALERKEPMREERKREEGTTCGLQENFSREVTTEMVLEGWVSAIQVKK